LIRFFEKAPFALSRMWGVVFVNHVITFMEFV
jgi:hypothetical protein